jgi:hypothetical protein
LQWGDGYKLWAKVLGLSFMPNAEDVHMIQEETSKSTSMTSFLFALPSGRLPHRALVVLAALPWLQTAFIPVFIVESSRRVIFIQSTLAKLKVQIRSYILN